MIHPAAIRTDGVRRVIIAHNIEDVGAVGGPATKRTSQSNQGYPEEWQLILHACHCAQNLTRGNS
jgi:hypothetical protein